MKKIWITALCLLLLSGCGSAQQGASLQKQYAAVTGAELTAEITCHLPDEKRQYQVNCTYDAENGSDVVITEPAELAGIKATVSGDDLTLTYEDLALSAGTLEAISPVNCLPWLMHAAADGYVLEEGRETIEERDCLRVAFDTSDPRGEKVLCTAWFDRETLHPVYSEFTLDGQLLLSVRVISFTAKTVAPVEP